MNRSRRAVLILALLASWAGPIATVRADPASDRMPAAAAEGTDVSSLSKDVQNPVSSLISVPLQFNFNFETGLYDRSQFLLNFQPVIPFSLSRKWNLVMRSILPILVQPVGPTDRDFGLGDLQVSLFFARSWGVFTMGVGPIFLFPTATAETLGTEKFGLGPTAVIVVTPGPWVTGILLNNVWSVAGDPQRNEVNQALFQPFLNYNFSHGWSISTSSQIVADWTRPNDKRWLIPIGAGFGKTFVAGKQAMNVGANFFYNVVRPDDGPDYQLRFNLTLLFPRKPKP